MYRIIITWDDYSSETEHRNDILSALRAVEIYIEDPHIQSVHIWDCIREADIFSWSR